MCRWPLDGSTENTGPRCAGLARLGFAVRTYDALGQGERAVEHVISASPRRVATAWLGRDLILGAEHTSGSKNGQPQFHPVTAHWRSGSDDVGWLRLVHSEPVDARASANRLEIEGKGEIAFQVCAAGLHWFFNRSRAGLAMSAVADAWKCVDQGGTVVVFAVIAGIHAWLGYWPFPG